MGIVVQNADSDNPIYTNVPNLSTLQITNTGEEGGLCLVSVMGATDGGQHTFYNGTILPSQSPVTVTLNNSPSSPSDYVTVNWTIQALAESESTAGINIQLLNPDGTLNRVLVNATVTYTDSPDTVEGMFSTEVASA
jgi:hypothetical protein